MEKPTCSVDECDSESEKRGLCGKHYRRLQRTGTTDLIVKPKPPRDNFAYFWPKVNKNGPIPKHAPELGPCWVWTGGQDASGYGVFYAVENGKWRRTRAHRWVLGQVRGKPLSREVVGEEDACHKCDNPPCVNPDHLYVGTRKQNIADAVERERLWQLKRETCPKGHPLDGVKVQKNGKTRRFCKTCAKDDSHTRRTTNRKTCKNDHPLEGDNIVLCKNGTRKCRTCEEKRATAAAERLRERWTADPDAMTEAMTEGRWRKSA